MTGSLIPGNPDPASGTAASAVASYSAIDTSVGALAAGPESEPGQNPLVRIISALRRFAWLIVLCTVLGTAGGIIATRFLEQVYIAYGTIFLQKGTGAPNAGPIRAPELLSAFNWVELIRTYAVLDPVVRELNLYVHPGKGTPPDFFAEFLVSERFNAGEYVLTVAEDGARYTLKNRSGNGLSAGLVTDSVGREVGFLWLPGPKRLTPGLKVQFNVLAPREAASALRGQLGAGLGGDQTSNFMYLQLAGPDPKLIAQTINAVEKSFMTVAADIKKQQLRELVVLLGDQVRQQEGKLRVSEQALESFKVATITQPREGVAIAAGLQLTTNPAYSRYFEQRVEIETIREQRKAIEEVLNRSADGSKTIDAFNTIPVVRTAPDFSKVLLELSQAEADLRALRTKYTDEYSDVRKLQERIVTIRNSTIPTYAQALVRQLRIQEADLDSRISSASQELKGIPTRTIEEGRLQREMESAKVLFLNLQSRYEEAKLAEISAIPDVSIMDTSLPPTTPQKNRASMFIMMGLAGGLGAGIGLAILLDRLDKRFRYPDQASRELGLTILGAVPRVPRPRNGKPAGHEEMSQVVEAFRSIRLNLAHSFEPGAPICITISSPSPGDGKSLISSNLALSFAEAGYRTILVDGDTRRGSLHRTFGADRRPGLLDFLSTPNSTIEGILRQTSHKNLTLIPCGVRLQHGPELLGSARMAEMVARLKSRFEVVLIDSPPLGAGIDPFVLGTHSGNIMIVLRSGETDREMAEVKLRILDRLPVRTLGAVLNHIEAGAGAYKYYSYSYGYAAEDEGAGNQLARGEAPVGEK